MDPLTPDDINLTEQGLRNVIVSSFLAQSILNCPYSGDVGDWVMGTVRKNNPIAHPLERRSSGSLAELMPLVYDELRRLANHYLRCERPDHTLQPTALVHEAYLRLIDQTRVRWQTGLISLALPPI